MQDNSGRSAMLAELGAIIQEQTANAQGRYALQDVWMFSFRQNVFSGHCFEKPLASLTVQGNKHIQAGPYELVNYPGAMLVTCVDMPSASAIRDASAEKPYLGMAIHLNRKIFAEILAELPEANYPPGDQAQSAWIMEADLAFLDAFLRLAKLIAAQRHIRILLPLILRELHYLILVSPYGGLLQSLYMRGARDSRIIDVIAWLKQNIAMPVPMEALARMANMSISSFHRHFKNITGFSPLQYHKKLRLHEAQRLLLMTDRRVTDVAAEVGYESITQFSREYRRLFGEPPGRDAQKRKKMLKG